ncbi:MAG TPA: metallophosphoesterase [Acidimicrobiales bacterium]|nr:metallophosphoesterase [Acidimicrobiales bacterium]
MQILLVSDLHYTLPQLDWVVGVAPDFDLVVLAGDTLSIRSAVPLEVQPIVVVEYLAMLRSSGHVVVSSGNHDLTGPDAHGEQSALWLDEVRNLGVATDGDSLLLEDTLVTVCPWWDGPLGRERVEVQLVTDAARRPDHWLWVYHWPPVGSTTCWTGRREYGDPDLRAWIEEHQPDVVLTGHVHESPFKPDGSWADRIGRSWVFNAGNQIGRVPAHVVLDLSAGRATWHSILGTEVIDLTSSSVPARSVF